MVKTPMDSSPGSCGQAAGLSLPTSFTMHGTVPSPQPSSRANHLTSRRGSFAGEGAYELRREDVGNDKAAGRRNIDRI